MKLVFCLSSAFLLNCGQSKGVQDSSADAISYLHTSYDITQSAVIFYSLAFGKRASGLGIPPRSVGNRLNVSP